MFIYLTLIQENYVYFNFQEIYFHQLMKFNKRSSFIKIQQIPSTIRVTQIAKKPSMRNEPLILTPDEKSCQYDAAYFRRTSCILKQNRYSKRVNKYELISEASPSKTLFELIESYFITIFKHQYTCTNVEKLSAHQFLNPICKHFLKVFLFYEEFMVPSFKSSQYEINILNEIININNECFINCEAFRQKLWTYVRKVKQETKSLKKQIISKYHQNICYGFDISNREVILIQGDLQFRIWKEQLMRDIIENPSDYACNVPHCRQGDIPFMMRHILEEFDQIPLFRRNYKIQRLSLLANSLTNYSHFRFIHANACQPHIILMKPLSNHHSQVIITLQDLIMFRLQPKDYSAINQVLIKNMVKELRRFQVQTSTQTIKNYYDYITPTTILFDQLSLTIQLSTQACMIASLGLKKHPLNIERQITFRPTPKPIDYFQNPLQYQHELWNEGDLQSKRGYAFLKQQCSDYLKMNDVFYGNTEWFKLRRKNYTREEEQAILDYAKNTTYLRIKQQVFNVLRISYYLTHHEQYGRYHHHQSLTATELYQFTYQQYKNMENGELELDAFLPINSAKGNKLKNVELKEIQQYLGIDTECDSILLSLKYVKLRKQLNFRTGLIKSIITQVTDSNQYARLFNCKKYMLIFLMGALNEFYERKCYLQLQTKKAGSLQQYYFFNQINRKQPSYCATFIENCIQKLQRYQLRADPQQQYLSSEIGYSLYTEIKNIYQDYHQIISLENQLMEFQRIYSEKYESSIKQQAKHCYDAMSKTVLGRFNRTKRVLFEYIAIQYDYPERYHKSSKLDEVSQNYLKIISSQFQLITITFLAANKDNFSKFQYIVSPIIETLKSIKTVLPRQDTIFVLQNMSQQIKYAKKVIKIYILSDPVFQNSEAHLLPIFNETYYQKIIFDRENDSSLLKKAKNYQQIEEQEKF